MKWLGKPSIVAIDLLLIGIMWHIRHEAIDYFQNTFPLTTLVLIGSLILYSVFYWRLNIVAKTWWQQLKPVQQIIIFTLTFVSFLLSFVGLISSKDIDGFVLNLATELGGAVITFILIDTILGRIEKTEEEKLETEKNLERLKSELASGNVTFATIAARSLVRLRHHSDGSLKRINLDRSDLRDVDFDDFDFTRGRFQHAKLQRTNFRHAILVSVDFNHAQLSGARLNNAQLGESTFLNAEMQDIILSGTQAEGARFISANLQRAEIRDALLGRAFFNEADLRGAVIAYTDIRGTNLRDANLVGARFENVIFDESTILPDGTAPKTLLDFDRFTTAF